MLQRPRTSPLRSSCLLAAFTWILCAGCRERSPYLGSVTRRERAITTSATTSRPLPSDVRNTRAPFPAKVLRVMDGDSLTVLDPHGQMTGIRLHAVDAPERQQRFSSEARSALQSRLLRQEVIITPLYREQNGRIVARVSLEGRDVALEQIRRGLAWHYRRYAREQTPQDRKRYADGEREARAARIGLWADPLPTAPWNYRHIARSMTGRARKPPYANHTPAGGVR